MIADPPGNYMVVYFDQSKDNHFPNNMFVTSTLESLAGGRKRPWLGPLLAVYENSSIFDTTTKESEAQQVVEHVHTIYERLHPANSVAFDALPVHSSVKHFSIDEVMAVYGIGMRNVLLSLGS
ncbi:hypothetical protein VNI00_008949 [Paramarasmius palmivorus]|uniref:Uncharacterized protein n=1 Tax=Paramarasmius palmivorus TaxID=297713 RepID=A0AAW0CPC8_9AGAR